MSESNELEALSATLGAKVAESRPLDTSVLNKDNESIKLVSVEQWIENVNELSKLGVGVIVKPSDDVKLLKDTLNDVALIALDFNNFDDGRGYSQAYLLSKRWKYAGKLLASMHTWINYNSCSDLESLATNFWKVMRALMSSTTLMDSVSAIKQQQTIQD